MSAPDVIARRDAMAQGLKRYFTGKPCRKAGHVAHRLCSNGECLACVSAQGAERSRRRYAADAAKAIERKKRWAAANPDKAKAHTLRWRAANPDAWRESNRKSKQARQKIYNERQRQDYALNPEKYRVVERKRRAQMRALPGAHTPDDIAEIMKAQGGRCAYCRTNIKRSSRHVDHIVPLALGGSNARTNIQIACPSCNRSKGAKDPILFAQSIGLLL